MTTSTGHGVDGELAELEDRTRKAWSAYSQSLKELEGKDYDDAEGRSWERLQRKLEDLDSRRRKMETQTSTHPGRDELA